MSDYESREARSRRLYAKDVKIKNRINIAKQHRLYSDRPSPVEKQPHRLYKNSCMNCGNSNCVMCGNPRKFLHEKTIQEMSFLQTEEWGED